ncbi:MAG: SpoIID/LytB domain-containing protein [Acidimicrobiales bacterium]
MQVHVIRRRAWRMVASSVVVLSGLLGVVGLPPSAAAYAFGDVTLVGHGWGPGIGMGQWGALGYALSHMSYGQILQHYYGQTTSGPTTIGTLTSVAEATNVRVVLSQNDGNFTIVTSGSPFSIATASFAGGQAAEMVPVGSPGHFDVYQGSGCAGPWPATPVLSSVVDPVATPAVNPALGAPDASEEALQLCLAGGNMTVRGSIEAMVNASGALRTVNTLPLEQYVAGVVPNESPASWGSIGGAGPQGQSWGFQELEAQAVAARSYVMSNLGSIGGYADICDEGCQSYRGLLNETPVTDQATMDTAGVVVFMPDGNVATTFYSSSTGGYTAASQFLPVVDAGDAVCVPGACNPHHNWQAQVPVGTIESTFPQIGTLESVDVTQRNGYGDMGGRVVEMSLVGQSGTVSLSGSSFAADFGLQSDWFNVASQASGGVAGYWAATSAGSVFSFGDAAFYGSMGGKPLDKPIVGMAATPDGRGYWLVASDGGIFSFGDAAFEGSLPEIGVSASASGIMPVDAGQGYLVVASDGGIFSFGDAPDLGDPAESVPGWSGRLVGAATVPV